MPTRCPCSCAAAPGVLQVRAVGQWPPGSVGAVATEKLSDKQLDGAVDAAARLRDAGLEPLFDLPTLRVMWKAGHHRLVSTPCGVAGERHLRQR